MPKHKPIRFERPTLSEEILEKIKDFKRSHPIVASAAKVVLATAALGGILTLAAVAPGLVGVMGRSSVRQKRERKERYDRLWQNFYRLKKERALEYVGEKNGELIYRLTKNGEVKLRSFLLETMELSQPQKWDGKWRVVVFDIPEKRRLARRALQTKLVAIGFCPLQKSVWVHPFPCEAEIEFLKDFFNVKPHVDILTTQDMPNGKVIYHFRNLLKDVL